ncbi:MAG: hypothetical protein ACHQ1H_03470 [Nitrososphaerales archaeon]
MIDPPQSVLDWLLESSEPAVCYLTLRDIIGDSGKSQTAKDAYTNIAKKGWVSRILDNQLQGGFWHNYELLQWPKYVSTAYIVMILVDLGLRADNPKLRQSCEMLLQVLSRTTEGGFAFGKLSHFCVTGNFVRTFINAGYSADPRVKKALEWIVEAQKEDGGWHCFPSKHGTLDCWEGLSAFAAIPREKRTRRIVDSIERGAVLS